MNWGALLGAAGAAYLFFRKKDEPVPCTARFAPTGSSFGRIVQQGMFCRSHPECCEPGPSGLARPRPEALNGLGAWPLVFPDAPGPTVLAMGRLGSLGVVSTGDCRQLYSEAGRGHPTAAARFAERGCCGRAGVGQSLRQVQRACRGEISTSECQQLYSMAGQSTGSASEGFSARFASGGCCGREGVGQSLSQTQRACAARAVARTVAFRF